MLTAAHDSSIRQVGTQRWLHKLSSRRHRRQLFGTLQTINGLRAVSVGSIRAFAEAAEFDFHAPPCKRCWWRLAAQLQADRMRAVLKGYTWLEALVLPIPRAWHVST